jgi:class 3 adenylate cyclase/DNA-binding winged helix-turn-helix (wHTH) protein/predicted ATPase
MAFSSEDHMGALGSGDIIISQRFRLDRGGRCLFRLEQAGESAPVALGSRTVDLLLLLLERRGQLVSRDEIMETVWAGRVVEEANLNVHVAKLRHILDLNSEQSSCIQTVPGRGYCFVGRVKEPSEFAVNHPSVSSEQEPNSIAQPSGAPRASIAVSPSTKLSEDPAQQYVGHSPTSSVDIAAWLRGLGLEQYSSAFRSNNIDADVLRRLTGEDLRALGVDSIGHRRRLLDAIAALSDRQQVTEASPAHSPIPPAAAKVGERRQLTVMVCNLVGLAALSTRLDPEDLREVVDAYHRCIAETVDRFAGFVAKHMADGVLVYFGYPEAHEDDAEQAVWAGLAVIGAVRSLARPDRLSVRLGVASGMVVAGDPTGDGAIVGKAPSLAARLQALAQPDTIVIAESTRRQIGALFEIEDLGPQPLDGFVEPQPAWRVIGESGVLSRFEALRSEAMALVGREEELNLLLLRWRQAKMGEGRVVLISGEPGIGKSRLVAALAQHIQSDGRTWLRYFCSPHHQDSALHPFIVQLERAAGFARDDTVEGKLGKLRGLLAPSARGDVEIELLSELLSLPSSPVDLNLSPQRKREKLFEALLHQLEALARNRPVLLVFEDAHWIDPTSRELLDLIIDRVSQLPLLVVVTCRPEFQHAWSGEPQVTMMALNRLDRRDRTILVNQSAGGKALPNEVVAQIADRADGVPLFLEELTKSVLESGLLREEEDRYALDGALPPFAIPATLHGSLLARLDRLGSARLVAQIGAAIGREFSCALLRAVSRLPEDELQAALGQLVASGLVIRRGTPPDAAYSFKHALVQDAAHGILLRAVRRQLHAQIADCLATQSPELMDSQPELFAQHYAEAGLVEKSVVCWGKAGHRSAARSAMVEAAAQLQKGLDQLALLPDAPERQRQELEFYSALGAVLHIVKGHAEPNTGHAFTRARELWEQLGSPSEFLHIPSGLSNYHAYRGELQLATRLDEDLLRLSRERNDPAALIQAHFCSGRNLMFSGKFAPSRSHLDQALTLHDSGIYQALDDLGVYQGRRHTNVYSEAVLGIVLFCLGYPDQALARSTASIAAARRLDHPPSLAVSLAVGTRLLSLVGNNAAFSACVDELIAVTTDQRFHFWGAQATIHRGWVKVKNGDVIEGMSLLRGGSIDYRASGAEMWTPHHSALLATAHEIAGQIEEALTLLDDALQIAEKTGERWFAAELNRHRGRLLLRRGHSEAAEEFYCKALSIAAEQEAKLWELRAAVSLARLRRDQGRQAEARDLLVPVYGWFTEGFDTPDLKEAKALLEELGG